MISATDLRSTTDVHNAAIEDNWSPRPDHRWTNRIALIARWRPVNEDYPKVSTVFDAAGRSNFDASQWPGPLSDHPDGQHFHLFVQSVLHGHGFCAHAGFLRLFALLGKGRQIWKFGCEQRYFYNNFSQPQIQPAFSIFLRV